MNHNINLGSATVPVAPSGVPPDGRPQGVPTACKFFDRIRTLKNFRLLLPRVNRKSQIVNLLVFTLLWAGCSVDTATEKTLDSKIFSKVEIIGSRGVGVGEFNKPRGVAVDREDNIYVEDMTGRVQKFTPDGKYVLQWQMPQTDLGKPKGMGRDADGNIIVIEPHYQRINIFSTDGKLLDQWGRRGTNAGQLIMPRSVAIDSHGDFFITEYSEVDRVQEFSAKDKKLLNLIGHPGIENGEFNRAEGIDIDTAGRIYVADSCNHRIQIFSPDGKWLRSYGKPGHGVGELSYPYDVRVDKEGRQYVCEFENSRIQIFDTNGHSLEIIGGPGYAPGEFSNPYGIALDSHGNLYVADSMNHRVQKFIKRTDVADARKLTTNDAALFSSSPSLPTQLEDHSARSARQLWGNHIVAGLGSHWVGERRQLLLTPAIAFLPSQPNGSPSSGGEGRGEGGRSFKILAFDIQRSMFNVRCFLPIIAEVTE